MNNKDMEEFLEEFVPTDCRVNARLRLVKLLDENEKTELTARSFLLELKTRLNIKTARNNLLFPVAGCEHRNNVYQVLKRVYDDLVSD